jgi:hypothetical protein
MTRRNGKRTIRTPKKAKRGRRGPRLPALAEHSDSDKAKAIAAFVEKGNVSAACRAAGIGRRTWYDWLESDEAFATRAIEAREEVVDELVEEAVQRAKDGSDTLLIFLLKAYRRAEYGDRQVVTIVSPQIRERLERQSEIIAEELEATDAERLFARLAEVWQ